MALSSTPRRTAVALGVVAVLLKLGATPAAAVPPVPAVPPPPDWYALCFIASPNGVHLPKVCIPDVTK
jgi:hypothetical protein